MGYPFGKKGWKLYDLDTKEFFVSRDVKFFEEVFPFINPADANIDPFSLFPPTNDPIHLDFSTIEFLEDTPAEPIPLLPTPQNPTPFWPSPPPVSYPPQPKSSPPSPLSSHGPSQLQAQSFAPLLSPSSSPGPSSPTAHVVPSPASVPARSDTIPTFSQPSSSYTPLGCGFSDKHPSVLLKDYVTKYVQVNSLSSFASPFTASSGTPYPIAHYINCANYSVNYRKFLVVVTNTEPRSFKEAMKDDKWKESMQDEIWALEENGTWTMESLPPGKKALGSQWVYHIKYMANGEIERLKSRLIVFGNHQEAGIDYNEIFAPVTKMTNVRAFLAIAASKNWKVHQMDVQNVFLHGDLNEKVYMKLPPGFEGSHPNLVCRLRKSLYDLKQAPRVGLQSLLLPSKSMVSINLTQIILYLPILMVMFKLMFWYILMISFFCGNDSAVLHTFKTYLSACFKMKDLVSLKYFLGIEVARSAQGLFLCQRKYTLEIISEASILGSKPSSFPIEHNHQLAQATSALLTAVAVFRRLVGRLIYLAVTQPDLAYSVHVLSQFMQGPRQEHWEAALRAVRYLKGTPD